MTRPFSRPALVCNSQSGSHDEAVLEAIGAVCREQGAPLAATFALPLAGATAALGAVLLANGVIFVVWLVLGDLK